MSAEITIGGLAHRVGVNIETIRYYERIGLMPRPPRTSKGRRIYDESGLRILTFIRKARDLGFSIEDTRNLLGLREVHDGCNDVKAIALRHREKVRADMQRALEVDRILSDAIERCPGGSTAACTILRVLENAA